MRRSSEACPTLEGKAVVARDCSRTGTSASVARSETVELDELRSPGPGGSRALACPWRCRSERLVSRGCRDSSAGEARPATALASARAREAGAAACCPHTAGAARGTAPSTVAGGRRTATWPPRSAYGRLVGVASYSVLFQRGEQRRSTRRPLARCGRERHLLAWTAV